MENANAIGPFAVFSAAWVTKTRAIRSESLTITSVLCGNPDRASLRGSVRCRWLAAADGKLRMEWQSTAAE